MNNGGTDSSSTENSEPLGTNGVTDRVNGSATDSEEDVMENEPQKHEPVSNGNGFSEDGEPEFKPKKVGSENAMQIFINMVIRLFLVKALWHFNQSLMFLCALLFITFLVSLLLKNCFFMLHSQPGN